MLHQYVEQFMSYCQIPCFSERSIGTLTDRPKKVNVFIESKRLKSHREIAYTHLIDFVSYSKLPSVHVKKSRVWAVKQIFHFLVLKQWAAKDSARDLAYPKIERKVPLRGCSHQSLDLSCS